MSVADPDNTAGANTDPPGDGASITCEGGVVSGTTDTMLNVDDDWDATFPDRSVAWAAHQNDPVNPGSNEYDQPTNEPDPDTDAGTRVTGTTQPAPSHHNPVALS